MDRTGEEMKTIMDYDGERSRPKIQAPIKRPTTSETIGILTISPDGTLSGKIDSVEFLTELERFLLTRFSDGVAITANLIPAVPKGLPEELREYHKDGD